MEATAVLKKTISGVLTLLRHTLLAFGEEPPTEPEGIFARIAAVTGADAEAFQEVYDFREGDAVGDVFMTYDGYIHALEKVIIALDGMVPKKEWQRAAK
jgi:hypothetical protein